MPNMFGKRDARQSATEAIILLREQLATLDKKEEHLERKVEQEHAKAKALVAAKKTAGASGALRRKKELEKQLEQLAGTRLTLETQVSALESAHFNAQTLAALSNSQRALRQIHRDLNINKVDSILEDLQEEIENSKVLQEAISTPLDGNTVDEDDLLRELEDLERETLDERLRGADSVPVAQPSTKTKTFTVEEEDEEKELRELQASLAL